MESVNLNKEGFKDFIKNFGDGPVVMLNLLKFRPGGQEQYGRYASEVGQMLRERGARVIYAGNAEHLLVGKETWDAVLIVEYPSKEVFIEMISSPEYQSAHRHREAGLERAVLYATRRTDLRTPAGQ